MMASLSGGLASMGSAIPYAIAAKYAHPGRPVLAIVGDGAMQMNGINGLITIARDWKRWGDPRLTVLVLNNADLNMVTWEQRATEGEPKFSASQDLPDFSYAAYGRMLGLGGIRVDDPAQVGPAWDEALASPRPLVLEMVVDANVPPVPPKVTTKQAKNYLGALLRRDPDAVQVARQTAREWWAGIKR
jgi:pyruvate dehydrogenase (quinone)